MASPNATFTEIVTTTLREHPSEISDNVSNHNAFYNRLKRKNNIRAVDGGYELVEPLDYAENQTYQRFSGYDLLNIQASDVLTAAKFDWVLAAVHVSASGLEIRQNSGRNQIANLVKSRLRNAMRTAANNMSVDLYSSGALTNQMGGLAHIIQDAGTGTVGGINSTTYDFWQNNFHEMTATPTKSNVRGFMKTLWLELCRGPDKPDLILSSHDMYSYYWESLSDLQRYSDTTMANSGFETLKFMSADVVFDSNTNFATDAQEMYFLNTDYLSVVEHRAARWSTLDKKISLNQDAEVIPMIWQGQMCCSNRSLQGKLINNS